MQARTLRFAAVLGIVVALIGTHSAAQGTDPAIGTWVLNVAKSTFNPGPGPRSESRTYVAAGKEIKVTSAGVSADGTPTAGGWSIVADGSDVPMTGNPNADTLSLKQIDAFNTQFALKKAGKVVITGTRTISQDGKVMTITNKGTNAKGQAVNDVLVYDKR